MNSIPVVSIATRHVSPKDGCSLIFARRWILILLLLGFVLVFAACGRPARVFLETAEPANPAELTIPGEDTRPLQIRYFFDRTFSMRGFATVPDSAYIRTIPMIWGVGDSLWPAADSFYYVYGTVQIGRLGRATLAHGARGLRWSGFYGDGPYRGTWVRAGIPRRPFFALNNYIHDSIDPDARSLYVVVTDLYEADDPLVFSRFFQAAFDKGLSGAMFAVESEFNGVVWDVLGYDMQGRPLPFPGPGLTQTPTGLTRSTFFILIIGSGLEVAQYSERLFSDLVGGGIMFNHTVFLVDGSAERVVSPETGEFRMIQNHRLFESDSAKFYMVNLRQLDNRQLGLFTWDGTSPVPAGVEAYQVMGGVGSRYSAVLTDMALGGFNFNVATQIRFHAGETGVVSPGTISDFGAAAGDHFTFRAIPYPVGAGDRFFRRLHLIGETRNHGAFASGFYRVSYHVQAEAIIPAWVMEKNAETIGEFEEAYERGDRLRVLGLRRVYNDIVVAYNRNSNRPAWFGELYLVRRR